MCVGAGLWFSAIGSLPLNDMTDVGLVSVLPPTIWGGIALVTVGFGIAWREGNTPLMALGVLATILVLHGLGVLGEPTMRYSSAWQHVGIADYIKQSGEIDPNIDAYFNWPGFFVLGAFLSSTIGIDNIEPVARYAPLFYNVLYLAPLVVIGRTLLGDRRLVWLGIWMFYAFNWVGQDYFSPQGLAFFFYLAVLAGIVYWFKNPQRTARWQARLTGNAQIGADGAATTSQRMFLLLVLVVIAVGIVADHQLTPFALVTASLGLTIVGWNRLRTLPLIFLLITLVWAAYLAVTYLAGHIDELVSQVGQLNSTVSSNVGGRFGGSPGHEFVVTLRLLTMIVLWGLAMAAFTRRAWRGELSLGLLALVLAPFPLVGMQSYGGEVLLRIALFSLPFTAFAIASLFRSGDPRRVPSAAVLAALACFATLALVAFPVNRYGNERMDYFPKGEVRAMDTLYRLAPKGSSLFAASWSLPWRYRYYAEYFYYDNLTEGTPVDLDEPDPRKLAYSVADRMEQTDGRDAFLVVARSTEAQTELFGPWAEGAQQRLVRVLEASPMFRVRYRNADATILQLVPDAMDRAADGRRA